MLPDRFDKHGRLIERDDSRGGGGGQSEMIEKLTRDFGDVVDGRKSWRDLLGDVLGDTGGRKR